jgi:hypothetical protein
MFLLLPPLLCKSELLLFDLGLLLDLLEKKC